MLAGIKINYEIEAGFTMMFSSSIQVGSGLSSSAAIECGFGYALNELFNLNINRETLARSYDAIIGARMMGGRFGGCTIKIASENASRTISNIQEAYKQKLQKEIKVYPVLILDGVHKIEY